MTRLKVSVGDKFNRLTVVGDAPRIIFPSGHRAAFHVVCDCGTQFTVERTNLITGGSKSCGCLQREKATLNFKTHGMHGVPGFGNWENMMARCFNPKAEGYERYGGRGITVCERWKDCANFLVDMGPTYAPGLTLEREDNDGDYEPGNVKWATRKRQAYNRRKQSNNSSGANCVRKGKGVRGSEFWEAKWREPDGKDRSRKFSIAKYGNDEAFRLACEASNTGHEQNGYSDKHGK